MVNFIWCQIRRIYETGLGEAPMNKTTRLTFERLVEIGLIPVGVLFLMGGWFVLNIWIPNDPTGIWQSMDCWQKISLVETMTLALIVGSSLFIIGSALLIRSHIITHDPNRDIKRIKKPPSGLRVFAFGHALAAIIVLYSILRSWINVNVLGGPSGFMHYVPLTFPLFAAAIEGPAIALALLTWFDPRQEYFYGWILITILRIAFSLSSWFLPWAIGLSPYSANLGPHFAQVAEFLISLISVIILRDLAPTFHEQKLLFHKPRFQNARGAKTGSHHEPAPKKINHPSSE